MASEGAAAKRANLVASRLHWTLKDLPESLTGSSIQSNISKWLNSPATEEDAKQKLRGAEGPVRRNPSSDDDLALGVEASLYGKQGVRTVQRFLRRSKSSSALSRWNSFNSTTSGHSGPLSVMDVLNLWNDDPEEVLLDLGFGCDEPDLPGRIPARFINYQSQARGINLQVFLEAQKSRLDLENPDVSNRFRQLEVLQQVTTAFSSLVGPASTLPPEAQERRRRVGMLFRRASKKSLSQLHNLKANEPTTPTDTSSPPGPPEALQPAEPSLEDKKVPLKKLKPGPLETGCLSPLIEEQGAGPDHQAHVVGHISQEGPLRPGSLRQGPPLRKRSQGHAIESFELEEIQSFDDSTGTGAYTGGAENLVRGVMRTNSCQSDSSGFLEEPFILPHQSSPGHDLIKALSGLSEGSTESQSPSSSPPHDPLSRLVSTSPVSSYDVQSSEKETAPHQDQPPTELESQQLPPRSSSSPELQNVPDSRTSSLMETDIDSLIRDSEDIQTEGNDTPSPNLSTLPSSQPPSPEQSCSFSGSTEKSDSSGTPGDSQTERTEADLDPCDPPDFNCPSSENNQRDSVPNVPSPALNIPRSPASQLMETDIDSLMRDSDDIQTEDNDTPSSNLSTIPNDSEDTEALTFSTRSLSPEPNSSDFSGCIEKSGKPGDAQTERTEVALDPCDRPDFQCPSSENNQRDSVFYDPDEMETQTDKQKEQSEASSLSLELDDNNPSAPSPLVEDPTPSPQPPGPSTPDDASAPSSQSHGLTAPAAAGLSDMKEQGDCRSLDDNTDATPASPVQDVICDKMNHLCLDRNGEGEGEVERHTDSVQTGDTVVYMSDTDSSEALSEGARLASEEVCTQTEIDPQVPSCSLGHELSAETKQVEVSEMEISGTQDESSRSEMSSKSEGEKKDLIEVESLDLVFETSVDGSDVDSGDVDAFFKQLDSEGQVYWAEPIQLSGSTPVFTESGSFEASDGSFGRSLSSSGSAAPDAISSTDQSKSSTMDTEQNSSNTSDLSDAPSSSALASNMSSATTPDLRPSSRSVSVQMSSSPSSHIVQRKDVPYKTDSKYNFLPSIRQLDTSSPFRAVQEWTDMQIQRNNLLKKLSQGAVHVIPNEASVSVGSSRTIRRPTLIYSSSPSLPLLSNDWESNDCVPGIGRNYHAVSVSVDGGLWLDEDEDVDRHGSEDEEKLWEGNQAATVTCCCSCDHQYAGCNQRSYNKQHSQGSMPYSLADLEEMMLCLQQFRSVLSNMEEQLSEDQAAVYSDLSDQDRENIRDIEELRQAVKQEAKELEMQLNELAHYYDHSLKMRMDRLLDEQSLLCSQLGVFQPAAAPTSSSSTPNRTVATQCCLQPCVAPAPDVHSEHVSSSRQTPPESESACSCSPSKADKLDIVGLLQKMRTSHHDLWENK